ncbi:MAG: hypothetical protein WCT20_03620 [Candidatus Babeliales bacterium]
MKKSIPIIYLLILISDQLFPLEQDNIFLENAPELPPSSLNLIKNERKIKDATSLHAIKDAFTDALFEHKKGKRKERLATPLQKFTLEAMEKKELISKETHYLLQHQYDHPQLKETMVSFTFKKAPLRDAIALVSKLTHLQLVCDESIQGTIHNLTIDNLSAAQALNIILSNNIPRLALLQEQGVLRITTKTNACEALQFQAQQLLDQDYELSHKTMLHAPWNEAFKTRIEKLWTTMSSKDVAKMSYIAFDDATKKIFFKGKKSAVKDFQQTLNDIDIAIPQVRIDARVILAEKDFEESIGFEFSGIYDRKASINHFDFVGIGPNTNTTTDADNKPLFSDLVTWSMNFIPSVARSIKIPFVFGGRDLNTKRLNILLNAAEQKSEIKTILKPSLLVNNEELAEILVGEEMPQATRLDETIEGQLTNITTINYKDVGMKIRVKPAVTPDQSSILLDIYVEHSSVVNPRVHRIEGNASTSTFNYTIETSRSKNKVSLKNGQTTLISGLILNYKENERQGIPFLQNIPILGWFFSGSKSVTRDKQLLIFITPTLV